MLAIAYLPECALAWAKGWHLSLRMIPAMMARDCILPVIWIRGWLGGAVDWRECMSPKSAQLFLLGGLQRLFDVGEQIVGVFQADGQPERARSDAELGARLVAQILVRCRCRMGDLRRRLSAIRPGD